MLSRLQKGLWASLMFSATAMADAEPPSARGVLVVMARDMSRVNTVTVDLFQQVVQDVAAKRSWIVFPARPAVRLLQRAHPGYGIGAIPAVPRAEVAKGGQEIMPTVQEMLDTLAVPAALVVDCEPDGDDKVTACALAHYDRKAQRITGSSRKAFPVPVADATRWAPLLVATLKQGLSEGQSRSDRRILDDMLRKQEAEENGWSQVRLGLGFHGEAMGVAGSALKTMPAFNATLGLVKNEQAWGIDVSYGVSERRKGQGKERAEARGAGLAFALSSRALESLAWQLGFGAGVRQRRLERTGDEALLATQEPYLDMNPGLFWAPGPHFAAGIEGRFSHYFRGRSDGEGAWAGETFARQNMALGFALRFAY